MSLDYYQAIIDKYINNCEYPILDTAYYYGNTKTEQVLGQILPNLNKLPIIATKANPWFENDFTNGIFGQLSKTGLHNQLATSLSNLGLEKVDIFYLHCPDYETPFVETLEACDELWRKERFDFLGISNFSIIQLQEVLSICEKEQYHAPRYYQGMYNIICRKVEELFPLLEDHRMTFWGYNPLAGGLLTGKYKAGIPSSNTRFTGNSIYQNIFWKPALVEPLTDFFQCDTCLTDALQWLYYYSPLRASDKIILGVSTLEQLDTNMDILSSPISYVPERIEYLNAIYSKVATVSPNYFY
jgi:aflatoxin B1 aldehyde reductase